jgi:outer membrane protein OmpA-like peptidoglycan-associated protein
VTGVQTCALPISLFGAAALVAGAAWFVMHSGDDIAESIRADLARQGLASVKVTAQGRQVQLSGSLPAGVTPDFARALAQGATCNGWWGPVFCADKVTASFTGQTTSPAPSAAASAAAAAAAASGSSASTVALAAPAASASADPTARVLAAVPAASAAQPAATAAVPSPPSAPVAARPTGSAGCQAALDAATTGKPLEFKPGSPSLLDDTGAVLDRVAKVLNDCAGPVRIDSYTGTVVASQANRSLSQARADAVRDALVTRGIARERLQPQGLGATLPRHESDGVKGGRRTPRIEFLTEPG